MEKALINKTLLLQKYPGKGGWTFVAVPGIPRTSRKAFGYVKVKGSVDNYPLKSLNLMPMKNGDFFLPVKTEIRKKIKKEAGDTVKVILFEDNEAFEIPEEFLICLKDAPKAEKNFNKFSEGEQKYYINWIYSAKKEETKIQRIAKCIQRLQMNLKFADKAEVFKERR